LFLSDPDFPHIFTNHPGSSADTNSIMDVTTISGASAFQQQTIANNVSSSVAAKVLDSQRTQGAAVLKLLDASNIQATTSNSSHKLDVQA
jgi:hypothetical protein